jgi:hypothetical protein
MNEATDREANLIAQLEAVRLQREDLRKSIAAFDRVVEALTDPTPAPQPAPEVVRARKGNK